MVDDLCGEQKAPAGTWRNHPRSRRGAWASWRCGSSMGTQNCRMASSTRAVRYHRGPSRAAAHSLLSRCLHPWRKSDPARSGGAHLSSRYPSRARAKRSASVPSGIAPRSLLSTCHPLSQKLDLRLLAIAPRSLHSASHHRSQRSASELSRVALPSPRWPSRSQSQRSPRVRLLTAHRYQRSPSLPR